LGISDNAYGWLSSLVGNVRTTPPLRQVHISLSVGKILDHLDGILSGACEAKYGRFVFFTDLLYSEIGTRGNFDRQDFALGLGLSSTFATGLVSAGYRVIDDPRFNVDALAGVRGFYADNVLCIGQRQSDPIDRLRRHHELGGSHGRHSCPFQHHR
jgi:hypothetical protein